ncbi:uncharacterized protein [Typha latifolia]|uniref:uncharacterized protein n=1 Tax=Typha latifolia TaxID=4733 RepID=UPI003C2F4930
MEKGGCGQAGKVLKKGKKKQAKDELDRVKQAEKKKRRLEKALATSAAIISELEKKKQKKKEEQQRLDEEGAAIAEAVALHVLLGEDTEEPCHFMLNKYRKCNPWDNSSNANSLGDTRSFIRYSVGGLELAADPYASGVRLTDWGMGQSLPTRGHLRDFQVPYYLERGQQTEICPGFIAAQAVSSLQIAENPKEDKFSGQGAATVVLNRMLESSNKGDRLNFYREL